MRFMGSNFSDDDNQVICNVLEKMNDNFDLSEKFDELSVQERYVYIGICTGINIIVTMAEHTLEEKSAEVLNTIFGENIFEWNDGSEESDVLEDIENETIDKETFEGVMAEAVISSIIEDIEKN